MLGLVVTPVAFSKPVSESPKVTTIQNGVVFSVQVLNGEDEKIAIKVKPVIDLNAEKQPNSAEIEEMLNSLAEQIKKFAKNEYTFRPREASFEQMGRSVMVTLKYTSQNSYGADVVGDETQNFVLRDDGKFH